MWINSSGLSEKCRFKYSPNNLPFLLCNTESPYCPVSFFTPQVRGKSGTKGGRRPQAVLQTQTHPSRLPLAPARLPAGRAAECRSGRPACGFTRRPAPSSSVPQHPPGRPHSAPDTAKAAAAEHAAARPAGSSRGPFPGSVAAAGAPGRSSAPP